MGALRATLAALVLLAALLILATPLWFVVRIMQYRTAHAVRAYPRVKVSDLYPHLKPGDVLLFKSATALQACITHEPFDHVAVVVRVGGVLCLSEAQPGSAIMPGRSAAGAPTSTHQTLPSGAAAAPLLTRLKYYNGSVYVMRLSRPLSPDSEERLCAEAGRLHAAKHAYPTPAQFVAELVTGQPTQARHCFRHAADLLAAAGLMPAAGRGLFQVWHAICELPRRRLPGGYRYGAPAEVLYDIGAQWPPAN
jgi:hypothetical protein